jgi:trehalose/maltose transport system permease protein
VFWRVTLPLLRPTIVVAVIFRTLDALRVFDLFYILTSGSTDSMSMSVFARQQLFDFQSVGLGSAASTLLFLLIGLITIFFLKIGRGKGAQEDL